MTIENMLSMHARHKIREKQRKKLMQANKKYLIHAKYKLKRRQREKRNNAKKVCQCTQETGRKEGRE